MSTPTKWGTEFLVNTTITGTQSDSVIAALANGRFVVVWTDDSMVGPDNDTFAVRGQIFNADGSKAGSEFGINTDPSGIAGAQIPRDIIGLADGGFMVAWDDANSGFGGDAYYGAVGRIFHADGTAASDAFLLNTTTMSAQLLPALAQLADGRIVATWLDSSASGDPAKPLVTGQIFNADGSKSGGEFSVSSTLAYGTTITALSGGGFVVTWSDFSKTLGDNSDFAVHAQMFTANGGKSGAEFLVNTSTADYQGQPVIVALAGGGFAVIFTDNSQSGGDPSGSALRAQTFDGNGARTGTEFLVNTTTSGNQNSADAAALHDGRFVVAWIDEGHNPGDTSGHAIRAQVFNPDGSKSGGEFLVNTTTADYQTDPHLDVLADGRFAISWTDYSKSPDDSDGTAIRAQIFDPRESGVTVNGTTHDDDYIGSAFNDVLISNGGSDHLAGAGGEDTAVFAHNLNDYTVEDFGAKILVIAQDGTSTLTSIEHLQFADGTVTPDDGNPLFDTLYYLSRNGDVFHAHVSALDHFNTNGWHEGRDPNAFFSVNGYLATHPDVKASGMNPLDHYDQVGWKLGYDPGPNFDTKLYLLHNPDVAAAGIDPLAHFLSTGMAEGRQAYQAIGTAVNGFDAEYYLLHNPDVAASGVDPLAHFLGYGWHEGRNPNAWFDTNGYLSHYSDVAAAGVNPLVQYEQSGWQEGRDPSAGFDTLKYLAANPDVAAAHVDPLDHFINSGIYEGRVAFNDGAFH